MFCWLILVLLNLCQHQIMTSIIVIFTILTLVVGRSVDYLQTSSSTFWRISRLAQQGEVLLKLSHIRTLRNLSSISFLDFPLQEGTKRKINQKSEKSLFLQTSSTNVHDLFANSFHVWSFREGAHIFGGFEALVSGNRATSSLRISVLDFFLRRHKSMLQVYNQPVPLFMLPFKMYLQALEKG